MNTTSSLGKIKPEKKKNQKQKKQNKKTGPLGSSTPDLCDTTAALYQLS